MYNCLSTLEQRKNEYLQLEGRYNKLRQESAESIIKTEVISHELEEVKKELERVNSIIFFKDEEIHQHKTLYNEVFNKDQELRFKIGDQQSTIEALQVELDSIRQENEKREEALTEGATWGKFESLQRLLKEKDQSLKISEAAIW